MNSKAQVAAIDMALTLMVIALFISVVSSFALDSPLAPQKTSVREKFTHSMLLSVLDSSCSSPGWEGKSFAYLISAYSQNSSLNQTLKDEAASLISPYTRERDLEWVLYSTDALQIWVPEGRVLSSREVSAASAHLLLPENKTTRIYLFLRWD